MDLDYIFNLFNNEDSNLDNDDTSLLMDFSQHPVFWISGFNKVINNHLFFKLYIVKTFKNVPPNLDANKLENLGEELMFRKAWEYIQDMDLSKSFHIECIKLKANETFLNNLELSIKFLEGLEEYEKCALLKKIEDKVNEFLT